MKSIVEYISFCHLFRRRQQRRQLYFILFFRCIVLFVLLLFYSDLIPSRVVEKFTIVRLLLRQLCLPVSLPTVIRHDFSYFFLRMRVSVCVLVYGRKVLWALPLRWNHNHSPMKPNENKSATLIVAIVHTDRPPVCHSIQMPQNVCTYPLLMAAHVRQYSLIGDISGFENIFPSLEWAALNALIATAQINNYWFWALNLGEWRRKLHRIYHFIIWHSSVVVAFQSLALGLAAIATVNAQLSCWRYRSIPFTSGLMAWCVVRYGAVRANASACVILLSTIKMNKCRYSVSAHFVFFYFFFFCFRFLLCCDETIRRIVELLMFTVTQKALTFDDCVVCDECIKSRNVCSRKTIAYINYVMSFTSDVLYPLHRHTHMPYTAFGRFALAMGMGMGMGVCVPFEHSYTAKRHTTENNTFLFIFAFFVSSSSSLVSFCSAIVVFIMYCARVFLHRAASSSL